MRPRTRNPLLPKYVQPRHGAFYLTKGGKWVLLGHELNEALAKYRELIRPLADGLPGLIDAAIADRSARIAPATLAQYKLAGEKLKVMLAEFRPEQVQPRHIAQVRRTLSATPNMANRVLSVARIVFGYAVEGQLIDSNPAMGIKRCDEATRDRLIAQDEYAAIHDKAPSRLQCAMELMYLTGQRVNDVLEIRLSDIRDDGIYFRQRKTKAQLVVGWTSELRDVVERAKRLLRGVAGLTLLQGRQGKPVDYRSMGHSWATACKAAGVPDVQMRDIRAMAATATRAQGGNATALLGHKSKSMTDRYLRDKIVNVVAGPSFVIPLKKRVNNSGQN